MDIANLLAHIRTLAMLPETDDPVVSCYVALENRHPLHFLAAIYKEQRTKRGLLP